MIKRTVDISEQSYLHVTNKQLCVDQCGETVSRISFEDLGILLLENPAIVLTQSVVVECQKNNVALIFCDEKRLPSSVVLPLWQGNSLHTRVLREQLAVTAPTRKRIWKQVVRHKIGEQAVTLERAGVSAALLHRIRAKVKPGDPENCEAQAARHYWRSLMGSEFRRDQKAEGVNALLNYGYAIIRAMVARALVGTGLHPAMGIHHSNQYNGLCLADDMMEPFRAWIDERVLLFVNGGGEAKIDRQSKQALLRILADEVALGSQTMPLMVAAHHLAANFKRTLTSRSETLVYPQRTVLVGD